MKIKFIKEADTQKVGSIVDYARSSAKELIKIGVAVAVEETAFLKAAFPNRAPALTNKISFYSRCNKPSEKKIITIVRAFEIIASPALKKEIKILRGMKDKKERSAFKVKHLPAVTFQGTFSYRENDKLKKASGFAILDRDIYDDNAEQIKKEIQKDCHILSVFLSPSGGLKILVRIPIVKNDTEYKIAFDQVLKHFEDYKISLDEAGKDISRLCFLSYDPKIYTNLNAVELDVDFSRLEGERELDIKTTPNKDTSRSGSEIREVIKLIMEGQDKNVIFKTMEKYAKWSTGPIQYKELTYKKAAAWVTKKKKEKEGRKVDYELKGEDYTDIELGKYVLDKLYAKKRGQATEILVDDILQRDYIYTIRDDEHSEMWIYSEGVYIPDAKTYINERCREVLQESYSTTLSNQVIAKIEADTYIDKDEFFKEENIDFVAVQNGILNLRTKELLEFNPEIKFFNKLPLVYNEGSDCPNIKKFFKSLLKKEVEIKVIQETFGFLLYRDYFLEKAFMFLGSGRNGKGKTLGLMKKFLGIENCRETPLEDLEKDIYCLGELHKKLANLCGDLSKTALVRTGRFKNLSGRDMISAARKYKPRVTFVNYAKMIFAANDLPLSLDLSIAFFDRWIIIDFPFVFLEQKEKDKLKGEDEENIKLRDTDILEKISTQDEMSGLLNWALEGLDRLFKNKCFSYSPSTEETKEKWLRKSDSCNAFVMDYIEECYDGKIAKTEFRRAYSLYCHKHKLTGSSDKNIKNILETQMGVSEERPMINNKQISCWCGIKFKKSSKGSEDSYGFSTLGEF